MSTTLQAPASLRQTTTREIAPIAPRKYNRHTFTDKSVRVTFGELGSASMDVLNRMDHIWIRGQVEAHSTEAASQIRELLAAKLGVKSLGVDRAGAGQVSFELELPRWSKETLDAAHARVLQSLRKRTAFTAGSISGDSHEHDHD
jgi:hypothetical protein